MKTSFFRLKTMWLLSILALTLVAGRLNVFATGPLINGGHQFGTIVTNSVDLWTVTANAGDHIIIRLDDELRDYFFPRIDVYGPGGVYLGYKVDQDVVEFWLQATNTGTFGVYVSAYAVGGASPNGSYRISLAKTGAPFVVPANDEGGPMTNG